MSTTSSSRSVRDAGSGSRLTPASAGLAFLVSALGGGIAATIIALIGKAAGAPSDTRQLQPATYLPLVVIGVLAGTIGWYLIGRRAASPGALLRKLVPTVLVLSFIPDVLLGASGTATWGAVLTLMGMHLAVAAVALPAYVRFLPVKS